MYMQNFTLYQIGMDTAETPQKYVHYGNSD